jgi:hypothetical protein
MLLSNFTLPPNMPPAGSWPHGKHHPMGHCADVTSYSPPWGRCRSPSWSSGTSIITSTRDIRGSTHRKSYHLFVLVHLSYSDSSEKQTKAAHVGVVKAFCSPALPAPTHPDLQFLTPCQLEKLFPPRLSHQLPSIPIRRL